jgi:hypothetical protein
VAAEVRTYLNPWIVAAAALTIEVVAFVIWSRRSRRGRAAV